MFGFSLITITGFVNEGVDNIFLFYICSKYTKLLDTTNTFKTKHKKNI